MQHSPWPVPGSMLPHEPMQQFELLVQSPNVLRQVHVPMPPMSPGMSLHRPLQQSCWPVLQPPFRPWQGLHCPIMQA